MATRSQRKPKAASKPALVPPSRDELILMISEDLLESARKAEIFKLYRLLFSDAGSATKPEKYDPTRFDHYCTCLAALREEFELQSVTKATEQQQLLPPSQDLPPSSQLAASPDPLFSQVQQATSGAKDIHNANGEDDNDDDDNDDDDDDDGDDSDGNGDNDGNDDNGGNHGKVIVNVSSDSALDESVGANNTDDADNHATNNTAPAKDNSNPDLAKALALLDDISDPDSDLDVGSYFANDDTTEQANHAEKDASQSNPTDNAAKDNDTKNKDEDDNNDEDKDADADNNTDDGMSSRSQPGRRAKKTTTTTAMTTATNKTAPKKRDAARAEGKGKEVAEPATSGKATTPPKRKTAAKTVAKRKEEEEEELLKREEEERAEQLREKEEAEARAEREEDVRRQREEKEKEDKRKREKRAVEEEERANREEQARLQRDQSLEIMRKMVEDLEKAKQDALQALQRAQLENEAAEEQVTHVSPPPAPTKAAPEHATIVSVADTQLSLEPALPTTREVAPAEKSHFDKGKRKISTKKRKAYSDSDDEDADGKQKTKTTTTATTTKKKKKKKTDSAEEEGDTERKLAQPSREKRQKTAYITPKQMDNLFYKITGHSDDLSCTIDEYGSSYESHVRHELSQAPLVHKQDQKEFERRLRTAIGPALAAVAALVTAVSQLLPSNRFDALCDENPDEHLVQAHIMLRHFVLNQRNTHAHYQVRHTEPLGLVALTNQAQYIKLTKTERDFLGKSTLIRQDQLRTFSPKEVQRLFYDLYDAQPAVNDQARFALVFDALLTKNPTRLIINDEQCRVDIPLWSGCFKNLCYALHLESSDDAKVNVALQRLFFLHHVTVNMADAGPLVTPLQPAFKLCLLLLCSLGFLLGCTSALRDKLAAYNPADPKRTVKVPFVATLMFAQTARPNLREYAFQVKTGTLANRIVCGSGYTSDGHSKNFSAFVTALADGKTPDEAVQAIDTPPEKKKPSKSPGRKRKSTSTKRTASPSAKERKKSEEREKEEESDDNDDREEEASDDNEDSC